MPPKRAAEQYMMVHCQDHSFPKEILPKPLQKFFMNCTAFLQQVL